jgi:polyhydroxybutyrate depolymerase
MIQVGGTSRSYIMHVPQSYDGKTPMPMVIDWHPLFGSMDGERMLSGYAALGDKEGFITLFPQGIDSSWNFGPCCTRSRDVDDFGFAKAMVERMRTEGCIDTKRIYSVGYSNGGGMSLYLACRFADIFAAIAPAAFDLVQESEAPCNPSRPITVMSFRGTADPIVLYQAHESTPPTPYPLNPIHFLGAEGTFKRFAELNKCSGEPAQGSAGCQTYKECADGVEVTLCTTQGGGHDRGDANMGWSTLKRFSLP